MTLTDALKARAADAITSNLTGQQLRRHGKDQHGTPSGPTPWPSAASPSAQGPYQSYGQSQSYGLTQGRPNSYHGPSNNGGYGGHHPPGPYCTHDDSHLGLPQYSGPEPGQAPHSSSNYGAQLEKFLTGSKSSASNPKVNGKTNYAGIAEKFLLGTNHKDKKDPWGLGGGGWTGMGGESDSGMGMGESANGGKQGHRSDPRGLGTKEDWLGSKEDWGLCSGKEGQKHRKDLEDLHDAQDAMDAADIAQRIKDDGGEIDEDTAEAILEALVG